VDVPGNDPQYVTRNLWNSKRPATGTTYPVQVNATNPRQFWVDWDHPAAADQT
jgi:hypothetical protein